MIYNIYSVTSYEGEFPKGISIKKFKYGICNQKEFLGQVELNENHLGRQMPGWDNIEGVQSKLSICLEQGIKLNKNLQLMNDFLNSIGWDSLYHEDVYQISNEGAKYILEKYNIFVFPNSSWYFVEKSNKN